jgi:hypothetical protein
MNKRLLLLPGLLLALSAHAGPPFVTDDPEPVDFQKWEVNYALTGNHNQTGTSAFLPQVDMNYGIAEGVQFHIQPQLAYTHQNGSRAFGLGDTELGLKYRLTPETEDHSQWMISLYPLLELPTGDSSRGLGTSTSSQFLPIWFQTTRGEWTFYGGGGYWLNHASGSRNAWAGGWVALYRFTERLQLGGEIYGRTAETVDGRSSTSFSVGGTYTLHEGYNLLFSTGHGLSNVATNNQGAAYIALQVAY